MVFGLALALGVAAVAAATPPSGARPGNHQVAIGELTFKPDTLVVAVGDTVTWRNRDLVPHTVVAGSFGAEGDWSSGHLALSDTFGIIADRPGRVPYHCSYHPTMTGLLVVRP